MKIRLPKIQTDWYLLVLDSVSHVESGDGGPRLHVPQAAGLVTRCGKQLFAIRAPSHTVDATLVRGTAHFSDQVGRASVVDVDLAVEAGRGKMASTGGVADSLHEAGVLLFGHLELKGRTLEHADGVVFAAGHNAERPRWFEVARVDRLRLARDFTHRGARLSHEHMTKSMK